MADPELPAVVGVVGAGTMGAGIAQVALEAGPEVVIHDVDAAAIERGRARIRDGLARRASRLDLDADSVDHWVDDRMRRLRDAVTLDQLGAEAALGLVIEAAAEDLGLKQTIFRVLDAATPDDVLLATNTSALCVADIAGVVGVPRRVLGLHFFNPAPVMPLVEVVGTDRTDADALDRAVGIVRAWGKTPIRAADAPGFIVNRVNRPFTIRALRMLERGDANVSSIDEAMRGAGWPMGPFELMDLTGIDVTLAAATSIWQRLGEPERLRPSPIQLELVEHGERGRKDGIGFYRYDGGRPVGPNPRLPGLPGDASAAAIVLAIRESIRVEAEAAVAEGVARREDVELAVRLGAAHPVSPFVIA